MTVLAQRHTQEEIYQWLNLQAKTLNVQVTLFLDNARQEKEWLYMPFLWTVRPTPTNEHPSFRI